MRESTIRPRIAGACLAFYGLIILVLALWPWSAGTAREISLVPLRGIGRSLVAGDRATWINVVGNLVAFAPIGALLPLWRRTSFMAALAAGAAFSLAIELAQLALGFRVADIDDILLNTLGTGLGYTLRLILTSAMVRSINQPGAQ